MFKTKLTLSALGAILAIASVQPAAAFTPPVIDSTIATGTSRVAILQVIHSLAMRLDQGDSTAAAGLFSPASQLSLYFNDASSGQPKLTPTGFSGSKSGTSGTSGAGCAVQGQGSIASFFAGRAPNFGPAVTTKWPNSDYRTNVTNSLVSFSDSQNATVRSYVVSFAGTPKKPMLYSGQILTQLQFSQTAGWQITDLKLVFDTALPNFPCQN